MKFLQMLQFQMLQGLHTTDIIIAQIDNFQLLQFLPENR